MTRKDFELLMKELQLTGVVHKKGRHWYIRASSARSKLFRALHGEVKVVPQFSSHGSRLKKLDLEGYRSHISWLREEAGMRRTRQSGRYQKPLSTNQVIDILKKIARGELEAP
jgi:hypothetical protein